MLAQRAFVAMPLLLGLSVLVGCGTANIGDSLPSAVGGLPEGAPARPATPGAYPAVHDRPPPRATAILTEEEQRKLEDDLAAARKRATGGRPAGSAAKP